MMQPLSTTGSMLQANLDRRKRPNPGQIFDSVAYDVLRDGQIGWSESCSEPAIFNSDLVQARRVWEIAVATSDYIDVHVWRFVPSSFRLIVEDLHSIGSILLREKKFIEGTGHEFFVTLSTSGDGPSTSRMELATNAMRELAAVKLA